MNCFTKKAKPSASFDSSNKYVCDSNNNQSLTSNFGLTNSSETNRDEFLDVNILTSVYNMFHKRVFADTTTNKKVGTKFNLLFDYWILTNDSNYHRYAS